MSRQCQFTKSLFLFAICFFLFTLTHSSSAFSSQVTLTWDKNTDDSIDGYMLYYGTSSGVYQYTIDNDNQTSCSVTALDEGSIYYFAVTAYDIDYYESGFSNEIAYEIPAMDADGDGIADEEDNCPLTYNPDQYDSDYDDTGDVCDDFTDTDDDEIADEEDNCPLTYNPDQNDSDNDGTGNACDQNLRISGKITGDIQADVTISICPFQCHKGCKEDGITVTTDSDGYYSFSELSEGWHLVTPTHEDYSFDPPRYYILIPQTDTIQYGFTATGLED
jgi:hypothetical protein